MGLRSRIARLGVAGQLERSWQPDPPIPTNGMTGQRVGSVRISNDTAMRNSAVWAALDLRAGLMSSFPIGVYKIVAGKDVAYGLPPVLITPDGPRSSIREFVYSTQMDLDRAGNAFGLVTEFSKIKTPYWPLGIPARIELCQLGDVQVLRREGKLKYRICGTEYDPEHVWHERAHVVSGCDVGLSPVAYAAMTLGGYLSAQQFALDWFSGSGMPSAHLKNLTQTFNVNAAQEVKSRYLASVKAGGVFVTGNDWELNPMTAATSQDGFIEAMQYSVPEIGRFFGVPADLIDGAMPGSSITYASQGERNLQFKTLKLGPAVGFRQDAFSTLTPAPRRVILDTDTLLALDHKAQAEVDLIKIQSRTRAPSEIRSRDNLAPYTSEQLAEIAELFPKTGKSDKEAQVPA